MGTRASCRHGSAEHRGTQVELTPDPSGAQGASPCMPAAHAATLAGLVPLAVQHLLLGAGQVGEDHGRGACRAAGGRGWPGCRPSMWALCLAASRLAPWLAAACPARLGVPAPHALMPAGLTS